MTAADQVHGAWMRRCLAIDGGPDFETQDVVWIQAGACYADLRVPFHHAADTRCFAGRSGWIGDQYRWTHRIDLEGTAGLAADDVGDLTWREGAMIETGRFSTRTGAVAYREEWIRLPGSEGSWAAYEGPGSCLVRVGDHAIVVGSEGDFAAAYWRRAGLAWKRVRAVGPADALPSPAGLVAWPLVAHGVAELVGV